MASFNKIKPKKRAVHSKVRKITTAKPTTINRAGGQAFHQSDKYKLAFLVLTSFVEDQFYRTKAQTLKELQDAIDKVDPLFAAKLTVYARREYGMRSISHASSAHIANTIKGKQWSKDFFNKVVYRVDDASEILAAYLHLYGKPIPNSLKKGLSLSLSKFDRYQLAKYKGANDSVKLVDLFNLVHPKPSEANARIFKDLIEGNLASEGTWEAKISEAGQVAKNEKEKDTLKANAWKDLIETRKIGYFALLRNLRNILQTCDKATILKACDLLRDEKLIVKSLVLPFRYMTAQEELAGNSEDGARQVLKAINDAVEISLKNVPVFGGKTLVALDSSASMTSKINGKQSPAELGALFAAAICKANDADCMLFDDRSRMYNVNLSDSLTSITSGIRAAFKSGGTNFNCIFNGASKKYDRIFILSDMQAWVGYYAPLVSYQAYCQRYSANPKIFCFDLQGLGTMQFPSEGIYQLSGFSDKTMELLGVLEQDKNALLTKIEAVEI